MSKHACLLLLREGLKGGSLAGLYCDSALSMTIRGQ